MDTPILSIIMPVYNASQFIREAVNSVLGQTFSDFELILVDDGSTDESWEIINSFSDARLRLIKSKENKGAATAKNKALDVAVGKYIGFQDADDVSTLDRFEKQVRFLEKHPVAGAVSCYMSYIDEEGLCFGDVFKARETPDALGSSLLFFNSLAQSSMLIRRDILGEKRFTPGSEPAEDYDLWVRVLKNTRVWKIPEVLLKYRVHSGGVSLRRSDAVVLSVGETVKTQLKVLSISPSKNELSMHLALGFGQFDKGIDYLDTLRVWMEKLSEANADFNVYSVRTFDQVIHRFWFSACLNNSDLGYDVLSKYLSLRLQSALPLIVSLRFLSILRHSLKKIILGVLK